MSSIYEWKSDLKDLLCTFIREKQMTGFKYKKQARELERFDAYCQYNGYGGIRLTKPMMDGFIYGDIKFSKEAIKVLDKYNWPGNVRELANLVERVVVISQESLIEPEHLPKKYLAWAQNPLEQGPNFKSLSDAVEDFELRFVKNTLECCKSREEAASKLGISLSGLTRRMRRLKRVNNESQF